MNTEVLAPGSELAGRYRIVERIGAGAVGIVYRAQHVSLKKEVAIKVLRPEVSRDPEILRRFRLEAQHATKIGNQHIVDISDFGVREDGLAFFVMELLDGPSLAKVMESGRPLELRRVVRIGQQLCRALAAAHDAAIVHRDLKPENIFLVRRGEQADFVKVVDFGIAKAASGKTQLTSPALAVGTPAYMAPEQAGGRPADARTDVYALGIILYELVSGHVPFEAESDMALLRKQLTEAPRPVRMLASARHVPPALEAVIMRCLAKAPAARFGDMRELRAALEEVEQALSARDEGRAGEHGAEAPLWARLPLGWMAGGVVVVLLGAAAAQTLRSGQGARPPETGASSARERVDAAAPEDRAVPVVDVAAAEATERGDPSSEPAARPLAPRTSERGASSSEGASEARLDAAQLAAVVSREKAAVQRCYESALRKRGRRYTDVLEKKLTIEVRPSGHVQHVEMSGAELGDLTVCLHQLVMRWRFPPAREPTSFILPLVFHPPR